MLASLVVVVLGVLAAAALPVSGSTASFSLCYLIGGLEAETLDDPFAIAVELVGTYNTQLMTSSAGTYTPSGKYYQLLNATGTRQTLTRNGVTAIVNVVSLVPINGLDYNDNRLYVNNPTQWFDANGLAYNLQSNTEFPGKSYGSAVNVYRQNVNGPLVETLTSGINPAASSQQLYVDGVPLWVTNGGSTYTAGNCNPAGVDYQYYDQYEFVQPDSYTAVVSYHLAGGSNPTFTIDFSGTFTASLFLYSQQDTFGDQFLTIVTATGSRKYCAHGQSCITSVVNGTAPIGAFGFSDQLIFGYSPFLSYYGLTYTLAAPVPKPGYTSGHTTDAVNIYISQTGQFLEGFGVGGTGSNGFFDSSKTQFNLTIVQN